MRISLLQFSPDYLQTEQNLDTVEALLGDMDADLIVLPEFFATGYFFKSTEDVRAAAEPIPNGPTAQRLNAWAKASGATFVAGLPEETEDGALFNSAVVVTPRGWLGTYRKTHLFYEEKLHFAPGDSGFPVFTVTHRAGEAYRLGVMICFDWYFPEAARSLALAGADVIAHPSNLVRPDCPRSMPIRALENHVFTATANRIGTETKGEEVLTFIGQSLICDPNGQVLASASRTKTELVSADIDPASARDRQLTPHNHLFEDRRPEAYSLG
ncbi:MAG: acyltransferase [Bacteroidetes bacterium]|nr:acyltransferase [Bacteroidota bacterium]